MSTSLYSKYFIILTLLLVCLFVLNISLGSVNIPLKAILNTFIDSNTVKESWQTILINFRLPKAITAIYVGSGLSVCGLLMQTLFKNPLAGPYVLGISSGASLGVALLLLGSSTLGFAVTTNQHWLLPIAASLGAFIVLIAIITTASKIKNIMSILIIGLMFGSLTGAIISVLAYFSSATQLQKYLFWSFGSLGNLSWQALLIFTIVFFGAMVATLFVIKPLNAYLLGEKYAKSIGTNIKKSRFIILVITSLLTGVITAFVGPIAFIGLAVPHIAKLIFTSSNHKLLIPACALIGAIVLLICDCIAQLPNSEFTLPINAVTSLFGAPIVIWLLVRKKNLFV